MQKIYAVADIVEGEVWAYFSNRPAAEAYLRKFLGSTEAQAADAEQPGYSASIQVREVSLFDTIAEAPQHHSLYSPYDELLKP